MAPVLDFDEAPNHPHVKARGTFVELDGVTHPAPGHAFRARAARPAAAAPTTDNAIAALRDWLPDARIEALRAQQTFI